MSGTGRYHGLVAGYLAPPESAQAREANFNLFLRWSDAVSEKDTDVLRGLMADDIVIEIPFNESGKTDRGSYRIYEGADACIEFWKVAFKAEGKMHAPEEMELTANGDASRIFLECRGHLTMSSGKEYRNRYVMRMDLADGRVQHVKEYYNPIQSAYAFGRPIAGQFTLERL